MSKNVYPPKGNCGVQSNVLQPTTLKSPAAGDLWGKKMLIGSGGEFRYWFISSLSNSKTIFVYFQCMSNKLQVRAKGKN